MTSPFAPRYRAREPVGSRGFRRGGALLLLALLLLCYLPGTSQASEIIPLCSGKTCGWKQASVPANVTTIQVPFGDILLYPDEVAVAVGDGGAVLRSTDGGRSYQWVAFPEHQYGLTVLAQDPFGSLWAGGEDGTLAYSRDQGASWTLSPSTGIEGNITSLGFPTSTFAYATTSDGFYLSRDDGETWALDPALGSGYGRSASFYDDEDGWVDFGISPVVEYTQDGGASFTPSTIADTPPLGSQFVPEGPSTAWYVGQSGFVGRTTNGVTWKTELHPIGEKAWGLAVVNGSYLWEVADQGNIYYSPDSGSCWVEEPVPSIPDFSAVSMLNTNQGVVIADGAAMYTENGGIGTATNYTYPSSALPIGGGLAAGGRVTPTYDSDDGPLPVCSGPRPYDYDLVGSAIGAGVGAGVVTFLLYRREERRLHPPQKPELPEKAVAQQQRKSRYRNRRRYVGQ